VSRKIWQTWLGFTDFLAGPSSQKFGKKNLKQFYLKKESLPPFFVGDVASDFE
jgi:hypothetical protein